MDKIPIDFVFEFAKDLKKILDHLKNEYGLCIPNKSDELLKRLLQESSKQIETLFNKYKDTLELKLTTTTNSCNIELKNSVNELILIPESFFTIKNYKEIEENYDILLVLMKNRNFPWKYFTFRITQFFTYSNSSIKSINADSLEKIRFFMSFLEKNPNFIIDTALPPESKKQFYKPRYNVWDRKTCYSIYNKYIVKDSNFFNQHIAINQIPNYLAWNLNILFCENERIEEFSDSSSIAMYPLQVIENLDQSFNSIVFLMSNDELNENQNIYKSFQVEKFSILNNFNVFHKEKAYSKTVNLTLNPVFESYIEFIDNYNKDKVNYLARNKTFEFSINFKKKYISNGNVDLVRNQNTIKKYNLKYREKNDFDNLHGTNTFPDPNPLRILFKNRFSFPDFNSLENYLLIIEKKKNSVFKRTIEFFKLLTYQTMVYELNKKIVLYGYLPFNFDYNKEIPYILELLESLQTKFKFLVNNKSFKQSTLSIYSLPASNQFLEKEFSWKLNNYNLMQSIQQKENIYLSQIQQEVNA